MRCRDAIVAQARELGFVDIGVAAAAPLVHERAAFESWLAAGYAAGMEYLAPTVQVRGDVDHFLRGAKSVLVATVNAFSPTVEARVGQGMVARYARGRDYHRVVKAMLYRLRNALMCDVAAGSVRDDYRVALDAHPVLERAWARRAGLGLLGKNGCLITSRSGSWVVIGCLVTRLPVEAWGIDSNVPDPLAGLSCGPCTRCISACPTRAIVSDGTVDARLCIAYLTIENRGPIPVALREAIGDRLFGCDVCQEVCPFNVRREGSGSPLAQREIAGAALPVREVLALRREEDFFQRFAGSPVIRATWRGLLRNACVVAGNSGDAGLVTSLRTLLSWCEDAMVREHAEWAIGRLERLSAPTSPIPNGKRSA